MPLQDDFRKVMTASIPGRRTEQEKTVIKYYLVRHGKVMFINKLNAYELDVLCNEVECVSASCGAPELVCIQGERTSALYIVAEGTGKLYRTKSSNKELNSNLPGSDVDENRAYRMNFRSYKLNGHEVATLQPGSSFGEMPLLKPRGSTLNDLSMVLFSPTSVLGTDNPDNRPKVGIAIVIPLSTYNKVLRHHYVAHVMLADTMTVLNTVPQFKGINEQQAAFVASLSQRVTYPRGTQLGKIGAPITHVNFILRGEATVYCLSPVVRRPNCPQATLSCKAGTVTASVDATALVEPLFTTSNAPSLVETEVQPAAVFSRGEVFGAIELLDNSFVYETSAIVNSTDFEVLQVPLDALHRYQALLNSPSSVTFGSTEAYGNTPTASIPGIAQFMETVRNAVAAKVTAEANEGTNEEAYEEAAECAAASTACGCRCSTGSGTQVLEERVAERNFISNELDSCSDSPPTDNGNCNVIGEQDVPDDNGEDVSEDMLEHVLGPEEDEVVQAEAHVISPLTAEALCLLNENRPAVSEAAVATAVAFTSPDCSTNAAERQRGECINSDGANGCRSFNRGAQLPRADRVAASGQHNNETDSVLNIDLAIHCETSTFCEARIIPDHNGPFNVPQITSSRCSLLSIYPMSGIGVNNHFAQSILEGFNQSPPNHTLLENGCHSESVGGEESCDSGNGLD